MTAAEELRTAAQELHAWVRDIPSDYWSPRIFVELAPALADWLDDTAKGCDATVVAAAGVWPDDETARGEFIAKQTPHHALALARLINPKEQ